MIERNILDISDHETYIDFAKFDNNRLQSIADFVVNKVETHISTTVNDEADEKLQCKYLNKQIIRLPKWFLKIQGHKLEENLKTAFPKLRQYINEPDLKLAILDKVIDDVPSLIPHDVVDLFKEIQGHDSD